MTCRLLAGRESSWSTSRPGQRAGPQDSPSEWRGEFVDAWLSVVYVKSLECVACKYASENN